MDNMFFKSTSKMLDCFYNILDNIIAKNGTKSGNSDDFKSIYKTFRITAHNSVQLPLARLFVYINSTPLQEFLLLLALAPHYKREYEEIFGRLNKNANETYATPQLVLNCIAPVCDVTFEELYESTLTFNVIKKFFCPLDTKTFKTAIATPLIPRKSLLNYVFNVYVPADNIEPFCEIYSSDWELLPIANIDELQKAVHFAKDTLQNQQKAPTAVVISAFKGSGKSFSLTYIASKLNKNILSINVQLLLSLTQEEISEALNEAVCHCFLWDNFIALENFEIEDTDTQKEVTASLLFILKQVSLSERLIFVTGKKAEQIIIAYNIQNFCITLKRFSQKEQQTFWERCSTNYKTLPANDINFTEISRIYNFTPAEIERIMMSVSADTVARGTQNFDLDMLKNAIRLITKPGFQGIATLLTSTFKKEDITLSPEAMGLLTEAINSAKYSRTLYEDWGFNKKLPYGSGISVLLYGPPGTGKTMAAGVLAAELGMDIYRIDLSQIVDKYIGETEKKLGRIFATAKNANAILFFDEADALFAKRTQVSDSKDKYSNMQTAYLLQKIEEHPGVSILATNIAGNFDNAFKRRIKYTINIDMPNEAMRLQIWNSVFPAEAPVDKSDFPFYAKKLELSGSSIKNIAVSAALLALAEDSTIKKSHILKAIKEEYVKTGGMITNLDIYLD